MPISQLYWRAIGLLAADKALALALATANLGVAWVFFLESWLFGRVVDSLVGQARHEAWRYIALWAGFGLAGIIANVWVSLYADRLAHRRRLAAIGQFFEHAMLLPLSFHFQQHTGRLLRIMHTGASNLFNFWLGLFRIHLTTFLSLMVMLPIALIMNWKLALLLTALSVTFAVSNGVAMRRTADAQQRVEKLHHEIAERAGDALGNALIVQSFTHNEAEAADLRALAGRALTAQYPVLRGWAWLGVANRSASTLTMVAIFALGASLNSTGEVTVGEVVTFAGFAMIIIGRLDALASFVAGLFFHAPSLRDFFAVLDTPSRLGDTATLPELPRVKGEVVFEDVSFSYGDAKPALKQVSFRAPAGSKVALVGATGAGKSTALSLLIRAHDASAGRILIDGVDIRSVRVDSLRRAVAVVFQDPGLLYRSIADNIRMGDPRATPEQIESAARAAQAHEFIAIKPEGYATLVAERGRSLSGGERQRLAIARAILKDAPILILDEASSALDQATEIRVQRALGSLIQGRTTLVIAHRLSTVRHCDWILVLKDGELVEQGRYDELMRLNGAFVQLHGQGEFVADTVYASPAEHSGSRVY